MAGPIRDLRTGLWPERDGVVHGFAFDANDPSARLVVEILVDGLPIALLRAQDLVDRPTAGLGAGCFGFSVRIDDEILARGRRLVARLANGDSLVGSLDLGDLDSLRGARPEAVGSARWTGGLRIAGHLAPDLEPERVPAVKALVEGVEVARASCRTWVQLDHGRLGRAFDLHLPEMFADGRVRPVEVWSDTGVELPGSPCLVVAFPDRLADWISGWTEIESETIRARHLDDLLPQSLPLAEVDAWLKRFPPPTVRTTKPARVAVAIVGEAGVDATVAALERQGGVDWSAAVLSSPTGRLCFDTAQLRTFLDDEGADCDLVVMAVSGTVLEPSALALLTEAAGRFPASRAFYPDVLIAAPGGRWPQAFPAFDPEFFLETGYCGLVYAVRREVAVAADGRTASLFDVFPFGEDGPAAAAPVHLPALLATVPELAADDVAVPLRRMSRARIDSRTPVAPIERSPDPGSRSVAVSRPSPPGKVSIVIAVRDNGPALDRTLASLDATGASARAEVVVVDNGSTDPGSIASLEAAARSGFAVLPVSGWFCVPHLLNRGSESAQGADYLMVLEAGVVAREAAWLDHLLGRCAAAGAGVVGALVAWPSGVVRDAGYVLGPRLSAAPRFTDRVIGDRSEPRLGAAHQCSAVSAACLLTPRRLFAALGGFDAGAFPPRFYAPAYCLRVREHGRTVVLDPRVRLTFEGAAGPGDAVPALGPVRAWEAQIFRHRWSVAPGCDPFYSPWMAMDGNPYSALAWPPRLFEPRQPTRPIARPNPVGSR